MLGHYLLHRHTERDCTHILIIRAYKALWATLSCAAYLQLQLAACAVCGTAMVCLDEHTPFRAHPPSYLKANLKYGVEGAQSWLHCCCVVKAVKGCKCEWLAEA